MEARVRTVLHFFHLRNNLYFHNWLVQLCPIFMDRKKQRFKILFTQLFWRVPCITVCLGKGFRPAGVAGTYLRCCSAEKPASRWRKICLGTCSERAERKKSFRRRCAAGPLCLHRSPHAHVPSWRQAPCPHSGTFLSQREDVKHAGWFILQQKQHVLFHQGCQPSQTPDAFRKEEIADTTAC